MHVTDNYTPKMNKTFNGSVSSEKPPFKTDICHVVLLLLELAKQEKYYNFFSIEVPQ